MRSAASFSSYVKTSYLSSSRSITFSHASLLRGYLLSNHQVPGKAFFSSTSNCLDRNKRIDEIFKNKKDPKLESKTTKVGDSAPADASAEPLGWKNVGSSTISGNSNTDSNASQHTSSENVKHPSHLSSDEADAAMNAINMADSLYNFMSADSRRKSVFQREGKHVKVQSVEAPLSDSGDSYNALNSHSDKSAVATPSFEPNTGSPSNLFNVDEDEAPGLSMAKAVSSAPKTSIEVLEEELLDDSFGYLPLTVTGGDTAVYSEDIMDPSLKDKSFALTNEKERYVPGQQIIPPGMTRYRVDVQYQGSDFDGWYKSSSKRLYRRDVFPDGSVRRVFLDNEANDGIVDRDQLGREKYFARSILEEALAVALDLPSVSVISGVIPETGVSVRRLCCHLDIPSDVEMQPRTVLQRATMWLEKNKQPLAILSFVRCKNQNFHARHSGLKRVYLYRILNRVAPPLFDAGLQWHVDRKLDVDRMYRFGKFLEGTKDFGYFTDPKMANALRRAAASTPKMTTPYSEDHYRPANSVRQTGQGAPKKDIELGMSNLERAAALPTFNRYGQTVLNLKAKPREYYKASTNLPTIRTIDKLEVLRQDDEVLIWIVGRSFLRQQIRNIVSVLKASGHGLWDELELQKAIDSGFEVSKKRFERERLPPAPVYGLTLWDIEYPSQHADDYLAYVDSGPHELEASQLH